MDLQKMIIEVLNEKEHATTNEIADTYLLQPRDKIKSCCEELNSKGIIYRQNSTWYLAKRLIEQLMADKSRLELEVEILTRENSSLKNTIVTQLLEEGKRRE